jgi:hypothetical protein
MRDEALAWPRSTARPDGGGRRRGHRLHHRGHRAATSRRPRDDDRPEPAPARPRAAQARARRRAKQLGDAEACRWRPTRSTATSRPGASSTGPTRSARSPRPTASLRPGGVALVVGPLRRTHRSRGGCPTRGCCSREREYADVDAAGRLHATCAGARRAGRGGGADWDPTRRDRGVEARGGPVAARPRRPAEPPASASARPPRALRARLAGGAAFIPIALWFTALDRLRRRAERRRSVLGRGAPATVGPGAECDVDAARAPQLAETAARASTTRARPPAARRRTGASAPRPAPRSSRGRRRAAGSPARTAGSPAQHVGARHGGVEPERAEHPPGRHRPAVVVPRHAPGRRA